MLATTTRVVVALVLVLAAVAPGVRAGKPEELDMLLWLSREESRSIVMAATTRYLELTFSIPKYCFSFSNKQLVVEGNTEGVPEERDLNSTATLEIVLQQANGETHPNWTDIGTLYSINFTDDGLERHIAQSLNINANYSDHFLHRLELRTSAERTLVLKVKIVTMGHYGQMQAWLGLAVLVVAYGIISFELVERALIGLAAAFITLLLLLIGHKVCHSLLLPSRPTRSSFLWDFRASSRLSQEFKLEEVATWLDQSTFVLLFGMMIIVKIFGDTGFFEWLSTQCIRLSRGSVRVLFVLICMLTAILSAFLDNVTTVLLSSPITVKVCEVLEISPVPFLIGQALMSNIGGTATLIGDPPNTWISWRLSTTLRRSY
jgi:hypothetical protein